MSIRGKIHHSRYAPNIPADVVPPGDGKSWKGTKANAVLLSSVVIPIMIFLAGIFGGCEKKNQPSKATGTIIFTANGEDFVRNGFVDRSNWHLQFDTVLVNLVSPTAYSHLEPLDSQVLDGRHPVDLAAGDENAAPVVVGMVNNAPVGNYLSLRFGLRRLNDGPYRGASIVLIGTATRNTDTVPFTIRLSEELDFDGKEGYVGRDVKGVLPPDDSTTVEMTFHFDHIFGDSEAPADDHINTGSVGFEFFHRFVENGRVDIQQEKLKDEPEYEKLLSAITTLGHLGEGHCEATVIPQ